MLTNGQRERLVNFLAGEHNVSVKEVERSLPDSGIAIPTQECLMGYVTQHQINLLRELFKENATTAYNGIIERNAVTEAFWVSIMIVSFMLGDEWRTRNITDSLFTDEKRIDYLRPRLETEHERYEHQFRMILLADSLFSLQDCEGFDLKIEELQKVAPTNPEVRLEDIVVELMVASMLVRGGHPVKFRPRSGLDRQDFDIEIYFRKRANIFAEIKCKRDETAVNVNNLRRTLYQAEKQLPTAKPGVVFVRIPTDWLQSENLAREVDRVIRNFFRNVSHVNAVVVVWEEWIELQDNRRGSTLKFRLHLHPSPQHSCDNLNELLLPTEIPLRTKGSFMTLSFGEFSDELKKEKIPRPQAHM
jgi:hypothetical protein